MSQKDLYTGCPVQHARKYISGKWQIPILWYLKKQPSRFVELKNILPGISEKVLTQELRFFEASGIIEKEVYTCIPPKVEYRLTSQGLTLIPVIQNIIQWGYSHLQEEKANRSMRSTPVSIITELEAINNA
ncbi:winged helix-turn-helix transcriptional regulator [Mucilaginibacter psychrotolerans]|uniref:Transcriptional regulator n=1 Tax=Mucilaginibacter psychrotolerans TaxID=1524096 RepID=A0A4Y8SNX0_9SPHI|nr:helix-turn-helix domain-containing protein [Mucilaginibacter psychrotolerans]TFF40638.1 transcriptional regulator [Mucilaginibacter psychrotolerans]